MFGTSLDAYAILWLFGLGCLAFVLVAGLRNLWRMRGK